MRLTCSSNNLHHRMLNILDDLLFPPLERHKRNEVEGGIESMKNGENILTCIALRTKINLVNTHGASSNYTCPHACFKKRKTMVGNIFNSLKHAGNSSQKNKSLSPQRNLQLAKIQLIQIQNMFHNPRVIQIPLQTHA